jgi:GNAT superfamily N-acetyltransferase
MPQQWSAGAGHGASFLWLRSARDLRGVIDIRGGNHISHLCVATEYQWKGIARELLRRALEASPLKQVERQALDVNASPNAVPAYEHLAFHRQGPGRIDNRIRSVAMVLELEEHSAPFSTVE